MGIIYLLCLTLAMHLPATGIGVPLYAESFTDAGLSLGRGERLYSRRFGMTLHWAPVSILKLTLVPFMSNVTDQSDLVSPTV